jgi:hypothetical protein
MIAAAHHQRTHSFFARQISFKHVLTGMILLLLVLLAFGWVSREPPAGKPYLKIAGMSFIFDYRTSQAFYGFTAYLTKPVPNYSLIEASFENPAGGEPFIVTKKLSPRSTRYGLRSPDLHGVKAHVPYHVHVRLLRNPDHAVLFETDFTITSQQDQSILPEKPLTIGPGYYPNPELPDLKY